MLHVNESHIHETNTYVFMGTEISVFHAYRDGYEKSNRSECKDVYKTI